MKMSTALIVAAAAGFAVAGANADSFNARLASNFGSGTGTTEGPGSTYQVDDGTSENSVGLTAGGVLAWMNAFTVSGGNSNITSIDLTFGTTAGSGLVGGEAFDVYVWSGTPTGANALLATASGSISQFDNDVFQNVAISANVGPDGSQFFIGASVAHAAGVFPMSLDQTSDAGVSFVAGGSFFDANNLAGLDLPPVTTGGVGLPGNAMIRANAGAIPTPGALGLFGIAGLAATRRRRHA